MIEKEYYELYVDEPEEYEVEFVEAKIKPEVVGHATPTEEAQTVTPAPGTTFSAVEFDAIPPEYIVPSGTKNITENGDYDVTEFAGAHVAVPLPSGKITITENATGQDIAQYAEADINVQPNLQTPDPITPTKAQQTVTADAGYDGLSSAVVEPIPDEYIVPSGKITLTENDTDVDIAQYEKADIAVPVPVMPEEYAIGGSLADGTATGFYIKRGATKIRQYMFQEFQNLTYADIPDSVETIEKQAFNSLASHIEIKLPAQLKVIGQSAFQGSKNLTIKDGLPNGITTIWNSAFYNCTKIDISKIPDSVTTLGIYAFYGCSNLSTLKLSNALTGIPSNCFASSSVIVDEIPASVLEIGTFAFFNCYNLRNITFKGKPNAVAANAFSAGGTGSTVQHIYVPWSEGEVANAPWGATHATIHYDYTGG